MTIRQWLDAHPSDPLTPDVHTFLGDSRQGLTYQRRYLGGGGFAFKPSR